MTHSWSPSRKLPMALRVIEGGMAATSCRIASFNCSIVPGRRTATYTSPWNYWLVCWFVGLLVPWLVGCWICYFASENDCVLTVSWTLWRGRQCIWLLMCTTSAVKSCMLTWMWGKGSQSLVGRRGNDCCTTKTTQVYRNCSWRKFIFICTWMTYVFVSY